MYNWVQICIQDLRFSYSCIHYLKSWFKWLSAPQWKLAAAVAPSCYTISNLTAINICLEGVEVCLLPSNNGVAATNIYSISNFSNSEVSINLSNFNGTLRVKRNAIRSAASLQQPPMENNKNKVDAQSLKSPYPSVMMAQDGDDKKPAAVSNQQMDTQKLEVWVICNVSVMCT